MSNLEDPTPGERGGDPEWVHFAGLSHGALHLYYILRAHEREHLAVSLPILAAGLRVTRPLLDRQLAELRTVGALGQADYVTSQDPPAGYTGPRTLDEYYRRLEGGEA